MTVSMSLRSVRPSPALCICAFMLSSLYRKMSGPSSALTALLHFVVELVETLGCVTLVVFHQYISRIDAA